MPGRSRRARASARRPSALRMQRQREVREAVRDRRQRVARGSTCAPKRVRTIARDVLVERAFRQAPQAAPDADAADASRTGSRRCARSASRRTARCGRAFCGRGAGSSAMRPSRRATQSLATGHASQRGRARVHTVAPRSIRPCVYASTCASRATSASASAPQRGLDFRRARPAVDRRDGAPARASRCRRGSPWLAPDANAADRRRRRAADAGQRRERGAHRAETRRRARATTARAAACR